MPMATPPPQERFDPIFGRWYTPGGPLHDPELESLDPEHRLPVELVGPVPPELAPDAPGVSDERRGRRNTRATIIVWVIIAVLASGATGLIMGTTAGYCPDPGECTVVPGGGPVGWAFAIGLVWLAVHAVRRALAQRRSRRTPG